MHEFPRSGVPRSARTPWGWIGVFLRGMAMGVAELVPGVSGGTIAFITGIYGELVHAIRSCSSEAWGLASRGRFKELWCRANLGFLALLGLGMAVSILVLAGLIAWLLDHRAVHVWAFFFGLIVASVIFVAQFVRPWTVSRVLAGLGGGVAGGVLVSVQPLPAPEHWISTVLAGAIAICAWILPGISGSFVLLLLGQYAQLVRALSELDMAFLAALAVGMVGGLLAFARVLVWLLRTRYRGTLATLTGLMAGSLPKLWPWREAVRSYTDSSGNPVPLVERPISPATWEAMTGSDPSVAGALLAMAVAAIVVTGLSLLGRGMKGESRHPRSPNEADSPSGPA
jgi:putative membrane protein